MKRQVLLDCALLCVLTGALVWPLFQVQYFNDWMSPEGTLIANAR